MVLGQILRDVFDNPFNTYTSAFLSGKVSRSASSFCWVGRLCNATKLGEVVLRRLETKNRKNRKKRTEGRKDGRCPNYCSTERDHSASPLAEHSRSCTLDSLSGELPKSTGAFPWSGFTRVWSFSYRPSCSGEPGWHLEEPGPRFHF